MPIVSKVLLQELEYAIRQSMAVREDQEDPADPAHMAQAAACGIAVSPELSKAELLSMVQTRLRAA